MLKILLTFSLLAALGGCGGGGSDVTPYQQAIDLANAKEAEARLLAVDTPCDQASQCGLVSFTDPAKQCVFPVFKAYSLVSPTAAAAKLASDQQLLLSEHARELSPNPIAPCPAYAIVIPRLACMASKCQTVP
jgi:hypothetical protein